MQVLRMKALLEEIWCIPDTDVLSYSTVTVGLLSPSCNYSPPFCVYCLSPVHK